ncbi:DNA-binding IclR family transcriptional regulator [Kineosphaera limosa]|uniref:Putative IclR family transcriptional regulator n=1 Tax=Kineosphaera limosa NBRC 100340 TaxID=1184609 RepID=K6VFP7_9MICO|nr:IclR family transcriptional regulator [Kineosphaera limosa]NYE00516.1 DNA-binding IclR family transcriptional regulator [Kineosphaera limosa]GAB95018.1 putative IclR family transcriptional regulator [Kineosphaera limosa NBRC 100340]
MPRSPAVDPGAGLNQSVVKALALLRATADDPDANVSSLARACGIPRATALRLIRTLEHEGFVLRNPGDERVLLGPEIFRLARGSDEQVLLQDVCRPIIAELVETIRETVTLSVVGPDGALDLVEQVDAPHQLRPGSWLGRRFPLHASASGKVLLATMDPADRRAHLPETLIRFTSATITDLDTLDSELESVRELGYAVASDEEEEGLTGVCVGISGGGGDLLGVLCVAGPTQRLDRLRGREAVTHLLAAARTIERVLRGST